MATTVPAGFLRTAVSRVVRAAPRLPYNPRNARPRPARRRVPFGRHLSVYDPTIIGSYDFETQRVVEKDPDEPGVWAVNLDRLMADAHALRAATGALVVVDRYDLVLALPRRGRDVLLDACMPSLESRVRETVGQLGYRYEAINIEGGPDVQQEDLTALTFADGSLTAAISLDTLEHIPDYAAALGELHRVLEPGGVAIVHTPRYYVEREHSAPLDPERDPWGHVPYFSARELLQTIADTAFRVLRLGFQLDYGAALCVLAKP